MPGCPSITLSHPATVLVQDGWQVFQNYASESFGMASDLVGELTNFSIDAPSFGSPFSMTEVAPTFNAPARPASPTFSYSTSGISDPGQMSTFDLSEPPWKEFPEFDVAPLVVSIPQPVAELSTIDVGEIPELTAIVIPDAPPMSLEEIEVPELEEVTIPTLDPIDMPRWTATIPPIRFGAPNENFTFSPEDYVSALLAAVQARIMTMLQGGTGIPEPIVAAIRERAYNEVDKFELQGVDEATVEFATRGYEEPNGLLAKRLLKVRQDALNKRSNLNRDILIKEEELEQANLQFAVQQGIACEAQTIALHLKIQDLLLDSAKVASDLSVAVFNARVALYNSQVEGYKASIEVFKAEVQAEIAKVEAFKAEVEAQSLVSEINKNRVAVYEQQIRAVVATAELYNSQVQGQLAIAQVNATTIEGYRAKVQVFSEQVRAYVSQWDAFRAQIEGEVGKARIYEAAVNGFSAQVQAVASQNDALGRQKQLEVAIRGMDVQAYVAKLQRMETQIRSEQARVAAAASAYTAEAAMYAADGEIARAAGTFAQQTFSVEVERERARTANYTEQARILVTEGLQRSGLLLEAVKGAAAVAAQLAGSAMSAVNFSAGAQSSTSSSEGYGCSTSYNYSGEVD